MIHRGVPAYRCGLILIPCRDPSRPIEGDAFDVRLTRSRHYSLLCNDVRSRPPFKATPYDRYRSIDITLQRPSVNNHGSRNFRINHRLILKRKSKCILRTRDNLLNKGIILIGSNFKCTIDRWCLIELHLQV